jgi:hypothetical protein
MIRAVGVDFGFEPRAGLREADVIPLPAAEKGRDVRGLRFCNRAAFNPEGAPSGAPIKAGNHGAKDFVRTLRLATEVLRSGGLR